MIKDETVLILGAGASCHLGYPLGNDLWKIIVKHLSPIKDTMKIPKKESIEENERRKNRDLLIEAGFSEKDINAFYNNLDNYGPITLDEFLENNSRYRGLAKLAIAQVLIPYEDEDVFIKQQDWYQKLFEKMKPAVDKVDKFHENNVTFMSFNYDRSLEQYLFHKLNLSQIGKKSECEEVMKKLKFIHIYGKLGDLPWQSREGRAYKKTYNKDELLQASKGIMTAHEQPQNLEIFENVFRSAKRILFLGFGFDRFNLDKLNLLPWVDGTKSITGTAFELGGKKRDTEIYFRGKNYEIVLRDMKVLNFLDEEL